MTLLGALAMGRARATLLMTDTVTVGVASTTVDPDTLENVTVTNTRYEGVARIKYPTLTAAESFTLGQALVSQQVQLHVPVGVGLTIQEGDTVTVTASRADASLSGRTFRVTGQSQAGQVTVSRFPLEELS